MNSNSKSKQLFNFPVGYCNFHKDKVYNFQLNRWHSLGYAEYDDIVKVAKKINSFDDWKRELIKLAQQAENENRLINAAYYYRAAEFYISPRDPDKLKIYQKFVSLIQNIIKEDGIEISDVPYENAYLPCLRIKPNSKHNKGVILVHGGFDSFKEEFYSIMKYLSNYGYEVIVFEGPGQGNARKKYNLALDYRWEKPVAAVLNYFNFDDVTLLGISFGGYLCFRAAAFEPRIKRVIASSIAYDYADYNPKIIQPIIKLLCTKFRNFINNSSLKTIEKGGMKSWWFSNMMDMIKSDKPIDAIDYITSLTADKLHCERVTQDVLILTGRDDHFSRFKMHKKQVAALVNAKSVTDKIFYKDSSASNHCQIGNMGLNLQTMINWIENL